MLGHSESRGQPRTYIDRVAPTILPREVLPMPSIPSPSTYSSREELAPDAVDGYIITCLRESAEPQRSTELIAKVQSLQELSERTILNAIWRLVERGQVRLTDDLKFALVTG
jgi:hypothetical protein